MNILVNPVVLPALLLKVIKIKIFRMLSKLRMQSKIHSTPWER
jgi:hypothetical protein